MLQMCLLKTTIKEKEKTRLADLSPGTYLFFPPLFLSPQATHQKSMLLGTTVLVITGSHFSFDWLVQDCGL